jgi:ABC-type Fe3+ transport system permease subunit
MALMFLLLVLQGRLLGGRSFTTVTGKAYSPNVTRSGWMRWPAFAVCAAFFAFTVALPIGQLLLSSFFSSSAFYQADMLTFEHYRNVWENANSGGPSATPCCWASSAPRPRWCWAASWPTSPRARAGAAGG